MYIFTQELCKFCKRYTCNAKNPAVSRRAGPVFLCDWSGRYDGRGFYPCALRKPDLYPYMGRWRRHPCRRIPLQCLWCSWGSVGISSRRGEYLCQRRSCVCRREILCAHTCAQHRQDTEKYSLYLRCRHVDSDIGEGNTALDISLRPYVVSGRQQGIRSVHQLDIFGICVRHALSWRWRRKRNQGDHPHGRKPPGIVSCGCRRQGGWHLRHSLDGRPLPFRPSHRRLYLCRPYRIRARPMESVGVLRLHYRRALLGRMQCRPFRTLYRGYLDRRSHTCLHLCRRWGVCRAVLTQLCGRPQGAAGCWFAHGRTWPQRAFRHNIFRHALGHYLRWRRFRHAGLYRRRWRHRHHVRHGICQCHGRARHYLYRRVAYTRGICRIFRRARSILAPYRVCRRWHSRSSVGGVGGENRRWDSHILECRSRGCPPRLYRPGHCHLYSHQNARCAGSCFRYFVDVM